MSQRFPAAHASRFGTRWQGPSYKTTQVAAKGRSLHWPDTLVAKGQQALSREHLRFRARHARAGILHCFLLDCSASMLAGGRLARAKGALMQLIQRAYQQRAEVAIIGFAGSEARVHLAPTAARPLNSQLLQDWLHPVQGGGATPFLEGVDTASTLLYQAAQRRPSQQRWLWLLSDGRSDESPGKPVPADVITVVDCEQQKIKLGRCRLLADHWSAEYLSLDELIL